MAVQVFCSWRVEKAWGAGDLVVLRSLPVPLPSRAGFCSSFVASLLWCMSYFFLVVDVTECYNWEPQRERRVYFGLQCQRELRQTWQDRDMAASSENDGRDRKLRAHIHSLTSTERAEQAGSGMRPWTRKAHLHDMFLKQGHTSEIFFYSTFSWQPSMQMHESTREVYHLNHHREHYSARLCVRSNTG